MLVVSHATQLSSKGLGPPVGLDLPSYVLVDKGIRYYITPELSTLNI